MFFRKYFCFIFLPLSACTGQNIALLDSPVVSDRHCIDLYRTLDRVVADDKVEDSGEAKIPGYPFLRTNRFFASFAGRLSSESVFRQWLDSLGQLDEQARILEFANLSAHSVETVKQRIPAGLTFEQGINECGRLLVDVMGVDDSAELEKDVAEVVPDNYQTWQRVLGLYPVMSLLVESRIDELHQEMEQSFQIPIDKLPLSGRLLRYRPESSATLTQQTVSRMLQASYRNPLQIPLLEPEQLQRIATHFAPVWEIDTRNDNDRIGTVGFDRDELPTVDIGRPAVYVHHAYTRYHGENLLQLVYQIWFPAREKTGWLDLYGGELDSVIWRVTLSRKGLPIAYDTIHACGCYYLLFPGAGFRARPIDDGTEPVLSPRPIDIDPYKDRLSIRLAARTHYLQGVATASEARADEYRFIPYQQLRSLEVPSKKRRNLFGREGVIESSARLERFLLWPFGVASPGAMRQWGSHAIAFIGRRHFDDPLLLEKLIAIQAE